MNLLAGVDESLRLDSWHFVSGDGEVHSAGDAFGPLLRELPRGSRLARLFELSPALTERGYRFVASRRTPLGKLVRRFGSVPPTG